MKKIAASKTHVLVLENSFKIYKRGCLEQVGEYTAEGVTAYFLHERFLFVFARGSGLQALRISGMDAVPVAEFPGDKVTALYARDCLLCVGTEGGELHTLFFNEQTFKKQKTFSHGRPISGVVSNGVSHYVTDYRDRVTEYPSKECFDFVKPKIFMNSDLVCVEGKQVFARTKDAFGQLFIADCPVDDLYFSEKGGYCFIRSGDRTLLVDSSSGETKEEYLAGEAVLSNGSLVSFNNGRFEVFEMFFKDKEMNIAFRKTAVAKKKVGAEDFDRKHTFIDDGNRAAPLKRAFEQPRIERRRAFELVESSGDEPAINDSIEAKTEKENIPEIIQKEDSIFKPKLDPITVPQLGPITVDKATLLAFTDEAFILSLAAPLCNRILIKNHNKAIPPVEFEDWDRSTMGALHGGKFVLSNRRTVNFNGQWKKDMECKMVSLDDVHVYVLSETFCVFSYAGDILKDLYIQDAYKACAAPGLLAVFSLNELLVISDDFRSTSRIPVRDVGFCGFSQGVLYVQIKNHLYRLEHGLLVKVCAAEGTPLAVAGDSLVMLASPATLLPKPMVNYVKMKGDAGVEHRTFSLLKNNAGRI